jgi:hypothetical protein
MMIGRRRFFPDKLIGHHMYELDLLADEKYETLKSNPENLQNEITLTIQTLKPSYPPELCPTCLREAFPILEWRPPSDAVLAQWAKEERAKSVASATTTSIPSEEETNILSAYLFHMLTDPDRMVEHNVMAIYRLWDATFQINECTLCASPLACEQDLPGLVTKLEKQIQGLPQELTEKELMYLVCLVDPEKWSSIKEDPVRWLPALQGMSSEALTEAKTKLETCLTG